MDYKGADVALIMCAGQGTRANLGYNKLFFKAGGKTVLEHTLDKFKEKKVLVYAPADEAEIERIAELYPGTRITPGAATRGGSVYNGLRFIGDCACVIIHDGARPNVTRRLIDASLNSAREYGSGIAYAPCADTVRHVTGGAFNRNDIMLIQTPQTFQYPRIRLAYDTAKAEYTDDCQVYEHYGFQPAFVPGDTDNFKITAPADLDRFSRGIGGNMRIGTGFDVHRLAENRRLILGGVDVPHFMGLLGHSDADVVLHALMDALLSAAGERDIGCQFPPSDPEYKDISSLILLGRVRDLLTAKDLTAKSISVVIHAERPRLSDHIPLMREKISAVLNIPPDLINISATTWEGLSFIGRKEALAASATVLVG